MLGTLALVPPAINNARSLNIVAEPVVPNDTSASLFAVDHRTTATRTLNRPSPTKRRPSPANEEAHLPVEVGT